MSVVVMYLAGGLGNQMFQYAAGRALALRCRAPLKLDISALVAVGDRPYALAVLAIEADVATAADLAVFGMDGPSARGPLRRVLGVRRRFRRWRARRDGLIHAEPHFHFDPRVRSLTAPVYLGGFWQSEKYFHEIADVIARELSLRAPLDPENARVAAAIRESNAVSLHVRRGDYVSSPANEAKYVTCSLAYYQAAMAHVAERVRDPHFYVFSDDPGWAAANLGGSFPLTFVTHNPPLRGAWDMHLMSLCRHHIIANSTFSWWGAWLNGSRDKIVVAPRLWYNGAPFDTQDLLPERWVRLG